MSAWTDKGVGPPNFHMGFNEFSIGDTTPNGFEVVDVNFVPLYKLRKRLETDDGWLYVNKHEKRMWREFDDGRIYHLTGCTDEADA